jgi:hypothetical protein
MEHKREKYERLIAFATTLPPLPTAVAHPCDHDSLSSVIEAARLRGILSPVAGHANVLVVPNLEAGNLLAKSLSFLAGADAAGIVLGARVPIILTSRADSVITRLASCAVASLVALARREKPSAAVV